jgi:cytoskeleton protein RodZ
MMTGMTPLPAPGVTSTSQTPVYQTTGPDLIVLKLTADSWIEIIDAKNTKVFFDLGRPGDVFNVRGTAPFDVLLGFAQAVSVEFNGKPFNAAPYSRAGVARFTLGE